MNTRRGKGYFYSMGAADAFRNFHLAPIVPSWPTWAQVAYMNGHNGVAP